MSEPQSLCLLYVTAGDVAEAKRLGRAVVEARLAACANILPAMTSIYRWQGAMEEAEEVVLLVKTTEAARLAATELLIREHSYDEPCVVALPITGGADGFLGWVRDQVVS